jgi:hypothetical protein
MRYAKLLKSDYTKAISKQIDEALWYHYKILGSLADTWVNK